MKPVMILDNHFRKKKELFRDETYAALSEICEIHGGIPQQKLFQLTMSLLG